MRGGDMDQRVTIERMTPDDLFDGAGLETWQPLVTCWAEVRQQGGREYLNNGFTDSEKRRVFFVRWIAGLNTADRVVYEGDPHNIVEVREIGRRNGIELHTVAAG